MSGIMRLYIMKINFAEEIIKNLEKRGETKDFIIGYLCATLNATREQKDPQGVREYLVRTVKQTKTNSI
jgi:hypothetical protein